MLPEQVFEFPAEFIIPCFPNMGDFHRKIPENFVAATLSK